MKKSRLKWYGLELKREEEYVGKRLMVMEVPRKRSERKTEAEAVG